MTSHPNRRASPARVCLILGTAISGALAVLSVGMPRNVPGAAAAAERLDRTTDMPSPVAPAETGTPGPPTDFPAYPGPSTPGTPGVYPAPPDPTVTAMQAAGACDAVVLANRGWQDTGYRVDEGGAFSVRVVAGQWYPDPPDFWHDASGGPNPWTCAHDGCHEVLHDFPKYALIGRIGGGGEVLKIGSGADFTAQHSGTLALRGNYGDVDLPIHYLPGSLCVVFDGAIERFDEPRQVPEEPDEPDEPDVPAAVAQATAPAVSGIAAGPTSAEPVHLPQTGGAASGSLVALLGGVLFLLGALGRAKRQQAV